MLSDFIIGIWTGIKFIGQIFAVFLVIIAVAWAICYPVTGVMTLDSLDMLNTTGAILYGIGFIIYLYFIGKSIE